MPSGKHEPHKIFYTMRRINSGEIRIIQTFKRTGNDKYIRPELIDRVLQLFTSGSDFQSRNYVRQNTVCGALEEAGFEFTWNEMARGMQFLVSIGVLKKANKVTWGLCSDWEEKMDEGMSKLTEKMMRNQPA